MKRYKVVFVGLTFDNKVRVRGTTPDKKLAKEDTWIIDQVPASNPDDAVIRAAEQIEFKVGYAIKYFGDEVGVMEISKSNPRSLRYA